MVIHGRGGRQGNVQGAGRRTIREVRRGRTIGASRRTLRVVIGVFCIGSDPSCCLELRLATVFVNLDGDVGGFLEEIIPEIIEVFFGDGPVDVFFVLFLFAEVGQVILLEKLIF